MAKTQAEIDAILDKVKAAAERTNPTGAASVSAFVEAKRGRRKAAPVFTGEEPLRGAYGSMILRAILGTSPQLNEIQQDRFLNEAESLADNMR